MDGKLRAACRGVGLVLGDAWTNVTDVPAGETWAYRTTWFAGNRTGEAADHAVLVTNTV